MNHSSGVPPSAPPALLKHVLRIMRASAAAAKAPKLKSADMSLSSRRVAYGSWRASVEGRGNWYCRDRPHSVLLHHAARHCSGSMLTQLDASSRAVFGCCGEGSGRRW